MKPAIAIQYFLIDRFFVESAFGFFSQSDIASLYNE